MGWKIVHTYFLICDIFHLPQGNGFTIIILCSTQVINGLTIIIPSQLARQSSRMLVTAIFIQLRTFVVLHDLHIMWVSLTKLEIIPGFYFYITEINSKHQSSFLYSFRVEVMLLLAILNMLKRFRWYFLMFANDWIYWKVELLQRVNMKRNNKKFSFDYLLASLCIIFHPNRYINSIKQ